MYEIKRIFPVSLAKYFSIGVALTIFILGLINFILSLVGIGIQYSISEGQQLIGLVVSVIFYAIFFWLIGYIFGSIYNILASKTKGIMIEFNSVDKKILEATEIKNKECSVLKKSLKKNEQPDKFVV